MKRGIMNAMFFHSCDIDASVLLGRIGCMRAARGRSVAVWVSYSSTCADCLAKLALLRQVRDDIHMRVFAVGALETTAVRDFDTNDRIEHASIVIAHPRVGSNIKIIDGPLGFGAIAPYKNEVKS